LGKESGFAWLQKELTFLATTKSLQEVGDEGDKSEEEEERKKREKEEEKEEEEEEREGGSVPPLVDSAVFR
jgi:hypothetical protein